MANNHMVSYPQSSEMSLLSLHHYLVLGHCADQTHKQLYDKSAQGERCMAIVDYDRCLLARERGYSTSLAKLIPQTCSPKNNLIVGDANVTSRYRYSAHTEAEGVANEQAIYRGGGGTAPPVMRNRSLLSGRPSYIVSYVSVMSSLNDKSVGKYCHTST
ncbi:hypothetical protein J6590_070606 [Homalodisca vitripennis]|nr:hypothetical protein J6590_070606 [Homalodisca vitripennis]